MGFTFFVVSTCPDVSFSVFFSVAAVVVEADGFLVSAVVFSAAAAVGLTVVSGAAVVAVSGAFVVSVVASVVVQRGTLHIGDPLVAGIYSGRVRAIFNDRGQKIQEATPSMPVEVLGLEAMPNAGDPIQVTETEKDARAFAEERQDLMALWDIDDLLKLTMNQ